MSKKQLQDVKDCSSSIAQEKGTGWDNIFGNSAAE
jgi:hypothetical protein